MKSPIKNRKGITLVELIVAAALMAICCAALAALIGPFTRMYGQLQSLNRAYTIADTLLEDIRGELLQAQGSIRLAASSETSPGNVFGTLASGSSGNAVEFLNEAGYVVLMDTGITAKTGVYNSSDVQTSEEPAYEPGYLHMRYYTHEPNSTKPMVYYYLNYDRTNRVRAITQAHAKDYYMGDVVELKFELPAGVDTGDPVDMLTVTVTVYEWNTDLNAEAMICRQQSVMDLPGEPVLTRATGASRKPA